MAVLYLLHVLSECTGLARPLHEQISFRDQQLRSTILATLVLDKQVFYFKLWFLGWFCLHMTLDVEWKVLHKINQPKKLLIFDNLSGEFFFF